MKTYMNKQLLRYYVSDNNTALIGMIEQGSYLLDEMMTKYPLEQLVKMYPYQPIMIKDGIGYVIDENCPYNALFTNGFHMLFNMRRDQVMRSKGFMPTNKQNEPHQPGVPTNLNYVTPFDTKNPFTAKRIEEINQQNIQQQNYNQQQLPQQQSYNQQQLPQQQNYNPQQLPQQMIINLQNPQQQFNSQNQQPVSFNPMNPNQQYQPFISQPYLPNYMNLVNKPNIATQQNIIPPQYNQQQFPNYMNLVNKPNTNNAIKPNLGMLYSNKPTENKIHNINLTKNLVCKTGEPDEHPVELNKNIKIKENDLPKGNWHPNPDYNKQNQNGQLVNKNEDDPSYIPLYSMRG